MRFQLSLQTKNFSLETCRVCYNSKVSRDRVAEAIKITDIYLLIIE